MRVMGLVAVYSLACGSSPGPGMVGVVAGSGMALDHVELFFGDTAVSAIGCDGTGPAISPKGLGCFSGSGWTSMSTTAAFEPATGGTTWFHVPTDTPIMALLAVGYAGGSAVGAGVVHDVQPGAQPIEIVLQKTEELQSQPAKGIDIWRRPADTSDAMTACALIAHDDGSFEFFVPADDTDCDGATMECADGAFDYCFADTPMDRSQFSCFADAPHAGGCHIAGSACADVGPDCPSGSAASCVPLASQLGGSGFDGCVPEQFCQGGSDGSGNPVTACDQWSPSCFTVDHFAGLPQINCSIPVQPDGQGGLLSCGQTTTVPPTIDVSASGGLLASNACGDINFSDLSGMLDQTDQLQIKPGNGPEIDIQLGSGSSCAKPVGFTGQGFGSAIPDNGSLKVDAALEIITINQQHRFVPIRIAFQNCATAVDAVCTITVTQPSSLVCL